MTIQSGFTECVHRAPRSLALGQVQDPPQAAILLELHSQCGDLVMRGERGSLMTS
jgi:hypothetical protein